MGQQIKTYRVLRDNMRVGDSVRDFGDYMPEAAGFSNVRTLINANVIEEVHIDSDVLEEWKTEMEERDERRLAALARGVHPDDIDDEDDEEDEAPKVKKPKKVVTKKSKKKTTAKKTVKKKGKANVGRLAEADV